MTPQLEMLTYIRNEILFLEVAGLVIVALLGYIGELLKKLVEKSRGDREEKA